MIRILESKYWRITWGVLYPQGFQTESTLFFQHDNIDQVVFEGYKDEEEDRFMVVYHDWEANLTVPRKEI